MVTKSKKIEEREGKATRGLTAEERIKLARELLMYYQEKRISLKKTPNGKILILFYDIGPASDEVLKCCEKIFGEMEGIHVNEKRGTAAAVYNCRV